MLEALTGHYSNVRVDTFDGLTVDYADRVGASSVLRGIRALSDYEYELQMALMNRKLRPELGPKAPAMPAQPAPGGQRLSFGTKESGVMSINKILGSVLLVIGILCLVPAFLPTVFGTVVDNFILLLAPSLYARTDTKILILLWTGISAAIGGIFFLQKCRPAA